MIELMPDLRVVLVQGGEAKRSWKMLTQQYPRAITHRQITPVETYHPSRQALFTPDPIEQKRRAARRYEAFKEVAEVLGR
jgi:hypothetical protein